MFHIRVLLYKYSKPLIETNTKHKFVLSLLKRNFSRKMSNKDTNDILQHRTFQADLKIKYLLENFPVKLGSKNKLILQKLHQHVPYNTDEIKVSRWSEMPFPENANCEKKMEFEVRSGIYLYNEPDTATQMNWYKNFADSYLFVAFDSNLFAQDEMQVAEHPILGNLALALRSKHFDVQPRTVEHGKPTPVLIQGAVRKIEFDSYNSRIYGNGFARVSEEAIKNASRVLDPPTLSNIFCIEAPPGGYGSYRFEIIKYIFSTAYTAYKAIKFETTQKLGLNSKCVLHTGFWGCGAFGGNHTLMTTLQIIAAECAGIDKMVFYKFSNDFTRHVDNALQLVDKLLNSHQNSGNTAEVMPVDLLLLEIFNCNFEWNVSDGN